MSYDPNIFKVSFLVLEDDNNDTLIANERMAIFTGGLTTMDTGPGGTFIVSATGVTGAISSVTNSDGTINVTPSTGAVVVSISNNVALPGNPTAATQSSTDNSTRVATTAFVGTAVSNAVAGVNPAVAVQAASAAVLPNSPTYSNGVSGVGATLTSGSNTALIVDGYTVLINDRVLVKNQTSAFQNGVYTQTTLGTGLVPWVLMRALDYNQSSDINNTGAVPVVNGTANTNTSWLLTSKVTTVGTDSLTYTQFSIAPNTIVTSTASPASGDIATYTGSGIVVGKTTVLPIANGGTNSTATPTNGGVAYGTGSAIAYSTAGSSEQVFDASKAFTNRRFEPALLATGSDINALRTSFSGWWMSRPDAGSLGTAIGTNAIGQSAAVTNGTGSNALSATDGGFVNYLSAATNGSIAGLTPTSGTYDVVARSMQPRFWVRLKTGASGDLLVQRTWLGWTSAALTGTDTPTTQHVASFRYATGTSDAHWIAVTCDGASGVTTVDTGVSVAASTVYTMCIDMVTSGHIFYYINGTQVADISTHLPGASSNLGPLCSLTTTENVAKNILFAKVLWSFL